MQLTCGAFRLRRSSPFVGSLARRFSLSTPWFLGTSKPQATERVAISRSLKDRRPSATRSAEHGPRARTFTGHAMIRFTVGGACWTCMHYSCRLVPARGAGPLDFGQGRCIPKRQRTNPSLKSTDSPTLQPSALAGSPNRQCTALDCKGTLRLLLSR